MPYPNYSSDLVWEIVNGNNSYLVKRKQAGGVQFSRDPLNLTNKHARKYEGFVNDTAFGLQPTKNGSVQLTAKRSGKANTPAKGTAVTTFTPHSSSRKIYRSVVNSTAKRGYRADLRAAAVSRASAIKRSQQKPRSTTVPKLRGAKAKRAAAEEA